jgi:thiol-disulfide isomerase/thioredoxin
MVKVKRFTAAWCGPCRQLAPLFEQIQTSFPDVVFETVDVDQDKEQVMEYFITSVPTVIFEKDGKRAERMPDWVKQKAWLWNKEEFSLMTQRYDYPRPTTGFISIYWLMNYCNCNVTITAFDFFKTRNRYTMEQRNGNPKTYVHDVQLEEEVITKLIQRGLINAI